MTTAGQPRGLDIGAAINSGWRLLWPNIGPMALFAVIVWAVNFLVSGPQRDGGTAGLLFSIIGFVITQLIAMGWITIGLDIVDGRPVTSQAVTDRFKLIGPYLLAAIVYAVMVTVGLLVLIVPGIILGITFGFYGFHMIDTGESDAMGALRRSAEITKGRRGQLFLFGLLLIGINIIGFLALIVGVLITSAISLLATAHIYRQLVPAGAGGGPAYGTPPGDAPA